MGRVEQVLGSRARIVLLRVLADSDTEMTGRGAWEAAKGRGGPSGLATVQRALDDLVRAGVVTCRDAFGFNAPFYRLDRTHPFVVQGILPLFELDGPIQDPAWLLKRLFAGADTGIGVYRAALEDPNATPGELVVHMVAQAGGDAGEAERRVRAFVEYVAGRSDAWLGLKYSAFRLPGIGCGTILSSGYAWQSREPFSWGRRSSTAHEASAGERRRDIVHQPFRVGFPV